MEGTFTVDKALVLFFAYYTLLIHMPLLFNAMRMKNHISTRCHCLGTSSKQVLPRELLKMLDIKRTIQKFHLKVKQLTLQATVT